MYGYVFLIVQICFAACKCITAPAKSASFSRCPVIFFRQKIHCIPVKPIPEMTSVLSSVAIATVSAALIYLWSEIKEDPSSNRYSFVTVLCLHIELPSVCSVSLRALQ
jgi:hypothetical protein